MRGFSQKERFPRALKEGYVQPEERPFHELLDVARSIARNIIFYDDENRPSGNWEQMFLKDEAFLLATVMSLRLDNLQERFMLIQKKLKRVSKASRSIKNIKKLFSISETIPLNLVHWNHYFNDLNVRQNVPEMEMELSGALQKLKETVNELIDLKEFADSKLGEGESIPWNTTLDSYKDHKRINRVPSQWADETSWQVLTPFVSEKMREIFDAFYATALFLKKNSQTYFKASLVSENHQTHSALLIAFLQLMEHANKSINEFPKRHHQFYFDKVLNEKRKPPTPDQAILTFDLAKTFDRALVPEGTLLSAGTDAEKNEILFATANDMVVSNATIADLRTVFVKKDLVHSPEGMRAPMVSGIYEARIDPAINKSLEESWPTLGKTAEQEGELMNVHTAKSTVGFEVSSPNLLLKEGKRKIDFTFHFEVYSRVLRKDLQARFIVYGEETEAQGESLLIEDLLDVAATELNAPKEEVLVLDFLDRITEDAPKGENTLYLDAWYKAVQNSYLGDDFDEPTVLGLAQRLAESEESSPDQVNLGQLLHELDKPVQVERKASVWEDFEAHTDTFKELKGSADFYNAVLQQVFEIALTTEEGWSIPDSYEVDFLTLPEKGALNYSFKLGIYLPGDFPPLVGMNAELHQETPYAAQPTARFTVLQNTSIFAYSLLNSARLKRIGIETASRNIRNIKAYNQFGEVSTDTSFQPFGPIPEQTNYVQIGAGELMGKNLTDLEVNLEWIGTPTLKSGFAQHYKQYPGKIDNSTFKVSISGLQKGSWRPKDGKQRVRLFNTIDEHKRPINESVGLIGNLKRIGIRLDKMAGFNKGTTGELPPLTNSTASGYIKLQLANGDDPFGHKAYPMLLTKATMDYSRAMMDKARLTGVFMKDPQLVLPNEPYTPTLNKISLNYRTKSEIDFEKTWVQQSQEPYFSHLHAFGRNIVCNDPRLPRLLPKHDYEGTLLIGLKDLETPQVLNLFFHLLESDNSEDLGKPTLVWYYLFGDQWVPFPKDRVLGDGTNGLLNSGIISLDLPQEIRTGNDLLDPALCWIKVCVADNTSIIGDAITVTHNAVEALWKPEKGSKGTHLEKPLPAGSISKLKTAIPGIKGVNQPIETFGGVPQESDAQRLVRITERQAHKNRAVTPWDYEKLVLQNFPEIKKAKCFPAMSLAQPHAKTPGHVLLGLIAMGDNQKTIDPQKPLVNNRTLLAIKKLLNQRSSAFAHVEVTNPRYETVRVLCTVKFKDGLSGGYYLQTLNADLSEHIAPWQYDPNFKTVFSGNLLESNILGFIQSRPYIKYVTELSIVHIGADYEKKYRLLDTARGIDFTKPGAKRIVIEGLYPWSILVPDTRHRIEVLNEEKSKNPKPIGVDRMVIESDFIVNE